MELLTTREIMQKLKISRPTLYRYVGKGLPKINLSTHQVRYDYAQVLEWVSEQNRIINNKRG